MLTLEMIKPFASKSEVRPILQAALVTEDHYIATDSHRAIRAKHNQPYPAPFLHGFYGPVNQNASSYPNVARLFPEDAQQTFYDCDVKQWLDIHKALLPICKMQGTKSNLLVDMTENKVIAEHTATQIRAEGTLSTNVNSDIMSYNCQYMIDALTVLHKMKVVAFTFKYNGPNRPFMLEAAGVEILILPVRRLK